ncbi:MAG: protease modulator HflC [Clostridia bacterium]|nr:protease modulator HflC [Clostridia bacterium]
MKRKKIIYTAVFALIIIIAAIVLFSSMYTVREDEFGIVKMFGKITTVRDEAGLYLKVPFVEEVSSLPKNKLMYDVPSSELLTSDAKSLVVDNYVIWVIEDPTLFTQRVGTVNEMEKRLDATIYSVVKNTMGTKLQTEIISAGEGNRNEVNKQITEQVNSNLSSEYGVSVLSVEIKKLDLPTDNESAVYARMISDREQIAAALKAEGELEASKIRNETDKQAAIIVSEAKAESDKISGEAEAEYMRIMAAAYNSTEKQEFYEFLRSLDAARISMSDGKKVLILPAASVIGKIFIGE